MKALSTNTATQSTAPCCEETCETGTPCRPRYFPRQIITPDDLTLEQDYFRARMRWHNLMLHGWGVVCGARVCPKPNEDGTPGFVAWSVTVERGYIIGPCGDEIILDCARTVDLRTSGVTGVAGDPCVEPVDPWCSDVYETPTKDVTLYVAIRYKQTKTRPVRIQPGGCGCDDTRCEYSRWCDSYEIAVLNSCPDPPGNAPNPDGFGHGPIPECPAPPSSPWVGLAEVDVSADGKVTRIDNCVCRRIVQSFGNFWWQCHEAIPAALPKIAVGAGRESPIVMPADRSKTKASSTTRSKPSAKATPAAELAARPPSPPTEQSEPPPAAAAPASTSSKRPTAAKIQVNPPTPSARRAAAAPSEKGDTTATTAAPQASEPKPRVYFDGKTGPIALPVGNHEVGRVPGMSIRLNVSQISREHAVIRVTDHDVVVEDLGSSNGTFVNMERITKPRSLVNGDLVQFGDIGFHVRFEDEPVGKDSADSKAS